MKAKGYATHSETEKLAPFTFERREPRDDRINNQNLHGKPQGMR